jgi:hypothetical protein
MNSDEALRIGALTELKRVVNEELDSVAAIKKQLEKAIESSNKRVQDEISRIHASALANAKRQRKVDKKRKKRVKGSGSHLSAATAASSSAQQKNDAAAPLACIDERPATLASANRRAVGLAYVDMLRDVNDRLDRRRQTVLQCIDERRSFMLADFPQRRQHEVVEQPAADSSFERADIQNQRIVTLLSLRAEQLSV